jgi:alanine dehydrogenase
VAFVAGTPDEMRRLPAKTMEAGFYPDYSDLITGKVPGRTSAEQITFYHNLGNQGLQFSSVGGLVYRKAKVAGLGREIPTEWFLQDIRN